MSDESAGRSEETTVGMAMTTGGGGPLNPTVTRPTGKLYLLNVIRLATDVIKKIAVQL